MAQCYNNGDFKKYFNENMTALGLAVPSGLFDSAEKATATTILILGTIEKIGAGATMLEIAGATVALEKLAVLSAISAVGYVGAVIGSTAVATGRSLGCRSRISDLFAYMENNQLKFNNAHLFYASNPQIVNMNSAFRKSYGIRCRNQPDTFRYG